MARVKDETKPKVVAKRNIDFKWIPIDLLIPNTWNVNQEDDITFNMLQDEIAAVGFIDPIEVVPLDDGLYVILAGEHRWRAAKNLNHEEVPCVLLTDSRWKEVDLQKFCSVRANTIHGKIDPDKFVVLYNEMVQKYGAESMQRLFGFVDRSAFDKMVGLVKKGLAKSLPKEMNEEIEKRTKEIKSVQDLERIIQELFAKYGDTLSKNFMVFTFGKQTHIYVAMCAKLRKAMDKVMDICRIKDQDINDFLLPAVEGAVKSASVELEAKQKELEAVAAEETGW